MMQITDNKSYRMGYEMLSICLNPAFQAQHHYKDELNAHINTLKRRLREYAHRDMMVDVGMGFKCERRVIKGDYDGYVELVSIPEVFTNNDEVKEFFDDFIAIPRFNSIYDCTGKPFTAWYKIFKRHGQYYIYHRVSLDV